MGRERQKKKNRSSTPRVTNTRSVAGGHGGRTKKGKRKVDFSRAGGAEALVVEGHWDRNLTLLQNYRRLGLTSRLKGATGGVEKRKQYTKDKASKINGEAGGLPGKDETDHYKGNDGAFLIPGHGKKSATRHGTETMAPSEVQVERDPATGRILRVISATDGADKETIEGMTEIEKLRRKRRNTRLDDIPDSDSDSDLESDSPSNINVASTTAPDRIASSSVIAELEAQASSEAASIAIQKQKKPRHQSHRETEWVESLVQKYGRKSTTAAATSNGDGDGDGDGVEFDFDYAAMARDRKLNPMQQTEMDIRRRVERWSIWRRRGGEADSGGAGGGS